MSPSTTHPFVARGDLQEDVWLGLYTGDGRRGREEGGREEGGGEKEGESQICVINFKGKASFSTQVSQSCNICVCFCSLATDCGKCFFLSHHSPRCFQSPTPESQPCVVS